MKATSRYNRLSRRRVAILLTAFVLGAAGAEQAQAQSATVRLVIDYGDGVIKTVEYLQANPHLFGGRP